MISFDFWGTLAKLDKSKEDVFLDVYNSSLFLKDNVSAERFLTLRMNGNFTAYSERANPTLKDMYVYVLDHIGMGEECLSDLIKTETESMIKHTVPVNQTCFDDFVKAYNNGDAIIVSDYYNPIEIRQWLLGKLKNLDNVYISGDLDGCCKANGSIYSMLNRAFNGERKITVHVDDNPTLRATCPYDFVLVNDSVFKKYDMLVSNSNEYYCKLGYLGGILLAYGLSYFLFNDMNIGQEPKTDYVFIGRDFGHLKTAKLLPKGCRYVPLSRKECKYIDSLEYNKAVEYLHIKGFDLTNKPNVKVYELSTMNNTVSSMLNKHGFNATTTALFSCDCYATKNVKSLYRFPFDSDICLYEYISSDRNGKAFNDKYVVTEFGQRVDKGIQDCLSQTLDIAMYLKMNNVEFLNNLNKRLTEVIQHIKSNGSVESRKEKIEVDDNFCISVVLCELRKL